MKGGLDLAKSSNVAKADISSADCGIMGGAVLAGLPWLIPRTVTYLIGKKQGDHAWVGGMCYGKKRARKVDLNQNQTRE